MVKIVGAGPGAKDLITVRGMRMLNEADVIIYAGSLVNGELLMVSQFTLYANCKKGNRPSFIEAGAPDQANELYEYMLKEAAKVVPVVQHGVFGADMKVSLENDGPFTVMLDESIL